MRVAYFSQVDRTTTLLAKPSVLPGVVTLEKPFKITCTLKNLRYIPRCSGHVCACVSSLCQPLSISITVPHHSAGKMVLRSLLPRQQEGGVLWTGISGIVSALSGVTELS